MERDTEQQREQDRIAEEAAREDDTPMRRLYTEALAEEPGNYQLAVTKAMTRWMEGRR